MLSAIPEPSDEVVDWLCKCMWPDGAWESRYDADPPEYSTQEIRKEDRDQMRQFLARIATTEG
jgi:hypothetical protein